MKQGEKLKLQERTFEEDTQPSSSVIINSGYWLSLHSSAALAQVHYVHRKKLGKCVLFPPQPFTPKTNAYSICLPQHLNVYTKWSEWQHGGAESALLTAVRKKTLSGKEAIPYLWGNRPDVPLVTWAILGFLWISEDWKDEHLCGSQSQREGVVWKY